MCYCVHGELSIDDNVSERSTKMRALGRRNLPFVASRNGGRMAPILFNLVANCNANHVEPRAWLRHPQTIAILVLS